MFDASVIRGTAGSVVKGCFEISQNILSNQKNMEKEMINPLK